MAVAAREAPEGGRGRWNIEVLTWFVVPPYSSFDGRRSVLKARVCILLLVV